METTDEETMSVEVLAVTAEKVAEMFDQLSATTPQDLFSLLPDLALTVHGEDAEAQARQLLTDSGVRERVWGAFDLARRSVKFQLFNERLVANGMRPLPPEREASFDQY